MTTDKVALRHQAMIYGPVAVLCLLAFVLAYQFIQPAPPTRVVIATGGTDGAYYGFAQRYAAYLQQEGIELVVRPSAGSTENVALLERGEVDLALIQGGTPAGQPDSPLRSLGSLYYEPLWLFHRHELNIDRLPDLAGLRIAVGIPGSGTRTLVSRLLEDNGLAADAPGILALGGEAAVTALIDGQADAIFMVTSASSPLIRRLLEDPRVALASMRRAAAYVRRYPFLTSLTLPEGAVDLARNIPSRDATLLAPAANLVATSALHPAIAGLILQAAEAVHRDGGWFESSGRFPANRLLAFPLSAEAARYYRDGPPFLQRYLPFWAASLIDRLKVMLVPLLVLLFPLLKIMPPVYTWRMRARVYRWYRELGAIDTRMQRTQPAAPAALRAELDRIEREVKGINVPLSFAAQLYDLRQHIDLVRQRLE